MGLSVNCGPLYLVVYGPVHCRHPSLEKQQDTGNNREKIEPNRVWPPSGIDKIEPDHTPAHIFVWGLSQAITLRVVCSGVPNDDIEFLAEADELGRFEDLSIISDNFEGTTKAR